VGAREIESAARTAVQELGLDAVVCRTGCIGFCGREPMLDLVLPNGPRISYGNMTPEKTRQLIAATQERRPQPAWPWDTSTARNCLDRRSADVSEQSIGLKDVPRWSALDFERPPEEIILRNCGSIDPNSLEERSLAAPIAELSERWCKGA